MNNRSQMTKVVQKARHSLLFEYFFKNSQSMISSALLMAFVIMLITRFFVLPFYKEISMGIATITFFIVAFYLWWKRPSKKQSLNALDYYFPDNILRTVYSITDLTSPLAQQLVIQTEKIAPSALINYKNRKKSLWHTKAIISSVVMILGIALLSLFPSQAQLTATNVKEEKLMISEIKKAVKDIEKNTEMKETKKALEKLQKDLKNTTTADEALQSVIKKQKELELQKQKLEDKKTMNGEELSKEEQQQLQDLNIAKASLSKNATQMQQELSNSGTPISPSLQMALNQSTQSNVQNSNSSNQSNSNNTPGNNVQTPASQGNNQGSTSSKGQRQGQNGSNSSKGNGGSSSAGNKTGNGEGNGSGNGSGNGLGLGSGMGAGTGAGNRSLIAVPKRVGEKGKPAADGGNLNAGVPTSIQENNQGKVTRGFVRSYKEVTEQYKSSYLQTTDRLQLPGELNQIVQKYFTSVEE